MMEKIIILNLKIRKLIINLSQTTKLLLRFRNRRELQTQRSKRRFKDGLIKEERISQQGVAWNSTRQINQLVKSLEWRRVVRWDQMKLAARQ